MLRQWVPPASCDAAGDEDELDLVELVRSKAELRRDHDLMRAVARHAPRARPPAFRSGPVTQRSGRLGPVGTPRAAPVRRAHTPRGPPPARPAPIDRHKEVGLAPATWRWIYKYAGPSDRPRYTGPAGSPASQDSSMANQRAQRLAMRAAPEPISPRGAAPPQGAHRHSVGSGWELGALMVKASLWADDPDGAAAAALDLDGAPAWLVLGGRRAGDGVIGVEEREAAVARAERMAAREEELGYDREREIDAVFGEYGRPSLSYLHSVQQEQAEHKPSTVRSRSSSKVSPRSHRPQEEMKTARLNAAIEQELAEGQQEPTTRLQAKMRRRLNRP